MIFENANGEKPDLISRFKKEGEEINNEYPMGRPMEHLAIEQLKTPEEIKNFYDQYVETIKSGKEKPHLFIEDEEKNASLEERAFHSISYFLSFEHISPETRKIWESVIGKKLWLDKYTEDRDKSSLNN